MEVPHGLIDGRHQMMAASEAMLQQMGELADLLENIPDGVLRESMVKTLTALMEWGKSINTTVRGIDELIQRVEAAADFVPGVATLTDPQRRMN